MIEAGQLWYDVGGKNFLVILSRPPDEELYWNFLVYYPVNHAFIFVLADPREHLENHCERIA